MVSGNKYHTPKKGDLPENLLPENNPVSGISPYRPFSAVACRVSTVACRVSPIACRVSALRLPFFWPSPAVFPPSRAVACRASTHRPAFFRRRLPCFCPLPAVFQLVACRRVPCFRPSPGFPPPSRAVLPPSPAVAYCASTHRPAFPAFNCHVSARRLPCSPHCLPSRAALPPIARLFSRRRLHCFIIKTKNCVCARNWHSECESVSRVHTLTLSHARTLTRSHARTLARSHAHTLTRSHAHTLTRSHAHSLLNPNPTIVYLCGGRETGKASRAGAPQAHDRAAERRGEEGKFTCEEN